MKEDIHSDYYPELTSHLAWILTPVVISPTNPLFLFRKNSSEVFYSSVYDIGAGYGFDNNRRKHVL